MTKRLIGIAAAAVAAAILAAPASEAYPDARVETQLRPDFGLLLNPPLRRHRRPHRHRGYENGWDYRHHWGWNGEPFHGRDWNGPLRDVALVDCSDAHSDNDINYALASLAPGGTLILRTAQNQGCLDSVHITKPVTIQGDGGQIWSPRGSRRHYRPEYSDSLANDVAAPDPQADIAPPPGAAQPTPADDLTVADDQVAALDEDAYGDESDGRRTGTGPVRRSEFPGLAAHLKSRPGQACIDIAPGAGKVVLRNLVIDQAQGGEAPCIYAENADVQIENSIIRYAGEGSAIFVDGGSLTISQDTLIDVSTYDRAIYAERARIDLSDFTLSGEPAIGIELVGPLKDSSIRDIEMYSRPQAPVFATPSVGLVISAANALGELDVYRARICGFGIGVWQQGANDTNIRRGLICHTGKGIVAAGGDMTVEGTVIGASLLGVQVGAAHRLDLNNLTIYGTSTFDIYREPGSIQPGGNASDFYSTNTLCNPVELDGRHPDYNRYHRGLRRSGRMYFIPGWYNNGGYCRDPGQLDPRYLTYERRLGYDNRQFYRMQPWDQQHMYHLAHPEFDPAGHAAQQAAQ
jgi:hypothetical protein